MLYTRPQLVLLLAVLTAAGAGLAVGHWRAHHPELVERLEQLDRTPADILRRAGGAHPSPTARYGLEVASPLFLVPLGPAVSRRLGRTVQAHILPVCQPFP